MPNHKGAIEHMFTIDLEAAYHHVDMGPASWPYLGFQWQGTYYVFRVLPFGLASACYVFTKITHTLVQRWRGKGVRLIHYLDYFCGAARPDADGGTRLFRTTQQLMLNDLTNAGFSTQPTKLRLDPSYQREFLGFLLYTQHGLIRASSKRRLAIAESVAAILARRHQCPTR